MTAPIPPVPAEGAGGDTLAELLATRTYAVEAMLAAEAAERSARELRREATRTLRLYERQLMEYTGQLTIDDAR